MHSSNQISCQINFPILGAHHHPHSLTILPQGMMSTSTEPSNKSSRTHPNTPTSRLARSAITSRQLFEESGGEEKAKKRYDDSMTATLLGSPMASATTLMDEFAGELPPPPSSPAISHAEVMEHLDESNFTFRKSHAGCPHPSTTRKGLLRNGCE